MIPYRHISNVVTTQQQAVWSIVAELPTVRMNNSNEVNFDNNIE